MAEKSLWRRMLSAVNGEYERRVRAASLVTEYGAGHHSDHGHAAAHGSDPHDGGDDDDSEVAEIVNVPKGTRVGGHARPTHDA